MFGPKVAPRSLISANGRGQGAGCRRAVPDTPAAGWPPCCPSGRAARRRDAARRAPPGSRRARDRWDPARTTPSPAAGRPRSAAPSKCRSTAAHSKSLYASLGNASEQTSSRACSLSSSPVGIERRAHAAVATQPRDEIHAIGAEAERGQQAAGGDLRLDLARVSILDLHHFAVGAARNRTSRSCRARRCRDSGSARLSSDSAPEGSGGFEARSGRRRVGGDPDTRSAERVGSRCRRASAALDGQTCFRTGVAKRDRRRARRRRQQPRGNRDRRRQIQSRSRSAHRRPHSHSRRSKACASSGAILAQRHEICCGSGGD